jgi:hypothetical protein
MRKGAQRICGIDEAVALTGGQFCTDRGVNLAAQPTPHRTNEDGARRRWHTNRRLRLRRRELVSARTE